MPGSRVPSPIAEKAEMCLKHTHWSVVGGVKELLRVAVSIANHIIKSVEYSKHAAGFKK